MLSLPGSSGLDDILLISDTDRRDGGGGGDRLQELAYITRVGVN